MSRILNQLTQEGHHIDPVDPTVIPGINLYGTDHLIQLRQYHLYVACRPPPYNLPITPPLKYYYRIVALNNLEDEPIVDEILAPAFV